MSAFHAWIVTHPWLTIAALIALFGVRTYFFVSEWRARSARVEVPSAHGQRRSGATMDALPPWQRIRRGGLIGLAFPGVFTILILVIYLIGGRYQRDHGTTTDMLALVILYPAGSAIMGAVLGFGAPFIRDFVRSALVGMLAVAPWIIGISLSMDNGLTHWGTENTIISAGMTVVFGLAIGYGAQRGQRRLAAAGSRIDPIDVSKD